MPQLNVFFLSPINAQSAPSSNEGASVSLSASPPPGDVFQVVSLVWSLGGNWGGGKCPSAAREGCWALGSRNAQVQVWRENLDYCLFVCLFVFSELKELIQVLGEDVQSLDTTITSPGSALDTPSQMLLKTSTAKAKVNRV